jgi:hypothetical protein
MAVLTGTANQFPPRRDDYLFAIYIVISNPKRISFAVGLVHIIVSLKIKYCEKDQFIGDAAARSNLRSLLNYKLFICIT